MDQVCHQWIKYVTSVRLAKDLTKDTYDVLFNYLQQYKKLVIASRVKKLEKTHDPLALVAHTSSSSRSPPAYYVTHPPSVVDYDDEYQGETFQNDPEDSLTSTMMLLALVQAARVNIQSRNIGNDGRIARNSYNVQEESTESSNFYNCNEKGHYARNCPKPRVQDSKYFMEQMLLVKKDEARVILSNEQNNFLLADEAQMEELEELSVNICMMARIQLANIDSNEGHRYDSACISEVQTPSTSYVNPLFTDNIHEQTYHEQPKIINSTIGDDQINNDIIFDDLNVEVNSGSVEHDKNVHDSYELEQLARNTYKEADKQQIMANKVKQQNIKLTKRLEQYKERVQVFETNKATRNFFHTEFIEDDRKAKRLETELQNQFILDRDKVRALEKERDDLQLNVSEQRKHVLELQNAQAVLKRKLNANEDKYLDDVLNLEAKLKKNKNVSVESDLDATWKQNEILNDQLFEATLKHDIVRCVLMCNDFLNNNLLDEIEKVKRVSIDVQENLHKRIKILEYDVQRCQKQSLDFELQLQHQNEKTNCESSLKNLCENTLIKKMEKLENENVSLEFQV
ncbi:integrase, catalytic region, zinc finger, CCHC-type containing protein [Tanacetum coccineum]